MKKIVYFLGSVYLAVGLIASSALIVIAGTLAESFTGSHLYAASLAYSNPVFLFLLSLFFVNILVSALRRWPFKSKHIPFLITHLGLLMIIGGVMIKNIKGTQGQMGLLEGTSSDTLIIPGTERLHVQNQNGSQRQYPLDQVEEGLEIVHFYPHGKESYETWIKGNFAFLDGIQPFPVYPYEGKAQVSSRMKIPGDLADHWDLYAYHAADPMEVAKKVYLEGLLLRLSDRKSKKIVFEGPFDGAIDWEGPALHHLGITIPLTGDQALLNLPYKELAADLSTTPKLLFVKDLKGDTHFYAFDAYGHFFSKVFPGDKLDHYIAYDKGFSGYSAAAKFPFPYDRSTREKKILEQAESLPPPLKLYLNQDWSQVSERERKGAQWGAYLLNELEEGMKRGQDLAAYLKNWPLASLVEHIKDPEELITALLQQVFMVAEELPAPPQESSSEQMLSVYLRVYGVDPGQLGISFEERMSFECPLTVRHEPLEPLKKLEDNRPMIVVKTKEGLYQTLLYDPYGQGLSWPRGGFLMSFRPEMRRIPFKIRLRDARQINYPQMDQAYSYESDLLITDLKNQTEVEKTVSMNEVHETWDGYRFYLSHIYPHEETSIQRIQLVVNRDPAKYWLTYPGGLVVALGILLLLRPRRD